MADRLPPLYPAMTEIDIEDDDKLRFIQRVLESNAPESDRKAALQMIYDIRTRVRKAHAARGVMAVDEALARRFHEAYERLAPNFGYETRAETREFDPSSPNGRLMVAVCRDLFPPGVPAVQPPEHWVADLDALSRAADEFDSIAEDNDSHGNNSAAESARARAYELRQVITRGLNRTHGVTASDGKGLGEKDPDALPHGFRE